MGLYARYILPRLTHLAMRQAQLRPYRERVTGGAKGRVLEIGIGSGHNLPFYGASVEAIVGVDPSGALLALAEQAMGASRHKVTLLERSAEELPLDDASFDTVVVTWSLCSIPDPAAALAEAFRVLRPDGELRFAEHGLSPDAGVRKWQDRLTPVSRLCAGGCHLNRNIDALVRSENFRVCALTLGYARGLRPMTYMYEGVAQR